jgi:putative inorganic carbon (hco3(-)) transporter
LFGCALFAVLATVGTDWGQKVPVLERIGAWLPAIIRGLPGAADGFHPAEVGGTLTWLLFLPIAAVIGTWPAHWRLRDMAGALFSIGLVLLMLFILVLTQSRSAWLGIVVGLTLFLLLAGGKGRLVLALGLTILVVVAIALGSDRIAANLTGPSSAASGTVFNLSLEGRSEIWSRAIFGIQDFSFTGMGLGTFRYVVRVLYPLFTISSDFDIGHAHNELLQSGVDLGLPGLIAFVSLQLLACGLALRAYQAHLPKMIHWAVIGTFAGLAAHAVFGLTDAVALGAKPGIFLWLLLGLIAIVWQIHDTADQFLL